MDNAFFEGFEKEAALGAIAAKVGRLALRSVGMGKAKPGMISKFFVKIPGGKAIHQAGRTALSPVGGTALFTGAMATGRAAGIKTGPQRAMGGYQGFR